MKYLIQHGHNAVVDNRPAWVVDHQNDFDTEAEALAHLEVISERFTNERPLLLVTKNVKMVDTGEDHPNKAPKLYHYITPSYPGIWHGTK